LQAVHLTAPATVWKYVEGACTRSEADLVMLDLEDSIPRGDAALLAEGRANVVRALRALDWGRRLRFFRPRGTALDPGHDDIVEVVAAAGDRVEGITLPKVEHPDEVRSVSATLDALEAALGLPAGEIRLHVLVESAAAVEAAFDLATASPRVAALVFGAFDFWASVGMSAVPYRGEHPLALAARTRVVLACAAAGIPAIAEMTTNYPTRDKSPEERQAALDECRRDAEAARALGFAGKWTGIPQQCPVVAAVFAPDPAAVARAVREVRAFREAEAAGRGAVMIDGHMADRATDRVQRVVLRHARARGLLNDDLARELGID
jgi:citrate lyase subunit beta/citryl-CoA lyase